MPCFKTLPLSVAPSGDVPLQDAVYVASVNKIFGVSGVHVLQFNASTGRREASVRISSPLLGDCRLVYHAKTGMLYASVWNQPNKQYFGLTYENRDVYPIDPTTLTVGARLNLVSTGVLDNDFGGIGGQCWGPKWIGTGIAGEASEDYLYLLWETFTVATTYYQVIRVNPTNLADRSSQIYTNLIRYQAEQCGLSSIYFMAPNPYNNQLDFAPTLFTLNAQWATCALGTRSPIACEYSDFDGLFYAVDGNGHLFRINDPTISDYTEFDLTASFANANPCRLRYSFDDTLLYLPCMTRNSILIWNQTSATAVERAGFENPVDVVFVPAPISKVFAVQNSPEISLKEVV